MRSIGLGLVSALLAACASTGPAGDADLKVEEFTVASPAAGVQLYLRNKAPASMRQFSAEKTVLFVHGATYPAETSFDLQLDGFSWMDYIARHGYDVYMVDVRGYGRSTRPAAMNQAPADNPPFATTEEAAADVAAAVNFILQKNGIAKL